MRRKALLLVALSLSVLLLAVILTGMRSTSNAAPALPAAGEDDCESSTPTAWYWYYDQTEAGITYILTSTNSRLIDISVETTTVPHKFNAVFVENTGVYAKSWIWYYDQTPAQVTALIGSTYRIIALKAYELSPGDLRFAFVAIANTGADNKQWWWYYNQTPGDISNNLSANSARLVQIHQYIASGLFTRYAVVMISNTGADNKAWWYYYGQTPVQIGAAVSTNNARVTDLDYDPASGNYNVIMEYWPTQPPNWWHLYGIGASQLVSYINQFAGRIIDLNRCGNDCFSVAMIDNADPITSRVGHMLRTGIGGQADGNTVAVGLYLKEAGQSPAAALERDFAYQPASSIKVAEHLYVMRRVQNGTSSLNDAITHYTNGADSCPNPPIISSTEPLTTALRNMMRYSDNARTREISDTFGVANFNAMMHTTVGMSADSHMGEIIGCAGNNVNRFTLADAGKLYEGVADGSLLAGQSREDFYYLMAGKEQYLEEGFDFTGIWVPALDQIISQEHPAGMTTVMTETYKSKMRLNYKAGGYLFCQNGPCTDVREYISVTGLVQIPFCSGTRMRLRPFAFGTFLHGPEDTSYFSGKNTAADQTFNATKAEVMREQIRAGLASCFFQAMLPLIMRQ